MNNIKKTVRRINNEIAKLDDKHKAILFVSQNNVLSQQTVIANMGLMYSAAKEKVLILDTDFTSDNIAEAFKVHKQKGLFDFLNNSTVDEKQIINDVPGESLSIIAAGNASEDDTDYLLGDPRLVVLLNQLVDEYDKILINTPVFSSLDSYESLAKIANGTVIVTTPELTTKRSVYKMLKVLKAGSAPILGYISVDKD